MAYKARPRAEDPNAASRTSVPPVSAPGAPIAPQMPAATGGAPKLDVSVTTPEPKRWYSPTPLAMQPWQRNPAPAPTTQSPYAPSSWALKDVAAAEPKFVKEFQNLLWERYQKASESERGGVFWQGVKQNPELAAATFVRQMLDNMKRANDLMAGEKPPTLGAAVEATMANSDIRQWLEWVRGNRKLMPKVGA